MSFSLVLFNAFEMIKSQRMHFGQERNGTVSFSVYRIRRYLVKMFAILLHCKITILFIFSKGLVERYFEMVYMSCFS